MAVPRPKTLLLAIGAAMLLAALSLAGCGGGDDDGGTSAAPNGGGNGAGAPGGNGHLHEIATVDWPYFGRVEERTHDLPNAPNPPFHYLWEFDAKQLVEFPPVVAAKLLFVVNKTGLLSAVEAKSGKKVWSHDFPNDVSGPAHGYGYLYLACECGEFTAVDAKKRKVAWDFNAGSELESSPLVADHTVYLGSDGGDLWAFDAATGKQRWHRKLGAAIKASPSLDKGVLYVGDYEGTLYALDASSGESRWTADTTELPPGGDGGFYASPSIAFGHVYEARDDGIAYAFTQEGKSAWTLKTGGPIYGSVALSKVKGRGPVAFVGSYDKTLYALDAIGGKKLWTHDVGGQIPGTPTVLADTVYTSSFQTKKTEGLDARTGKQVFEWGSAGYEPMVSDGKRVYLTGFQTVWGFDAKQPKQKDAEKGPKHENPEPQAPAIQPPPPIGR